MRTIVTAAILGGLLLATAPAAAQTGGNLPPTPPGDLRVVDVTPFSVVLAWDASTDDRDGGRLSYTVYGPADGPFGDQWAWAYETTSTTVERLTPGTTYTFTVRAMDSWAQESEPSEPVTVRTEEIDPLPVPTNVRVTRNATGTEVDLAFDAADDPRVAFYNIKRDGRQVGFAWPHDKTFTATGLDPDTTYEFAVAAVMSNHFEGPLSAPARVTTARDSLAPTAPRRLTVLDRTGTSVDLQWERATDNVAVAEYVVSDGSTTRTVPAQPRSLVTSFVFTGLAPETSFTFTVRARDAAGNLSPPSNVQAIATGVDPDTEPPAPVTGLQATLFEGEGIEVSWNPSTDNVTLQRALRYRISFENGASTVLDGTSFEGFRDGSAQQLFGCVPTVRAIDRAGNESEPRSTRVC
jgi:chitodextrinase